MCSIAEAVRNMHFVLSAGMKVKVKGRTAQARAGQDTTGQARAGQNMTRQGRAGQSRTGWDDSAQHSLHVVERQSAH